MVLVSSVDNETHHDNNVICHLAANSSCWHLSHYTELSYLYPLTLGLTFYPPISMLTCEVDLKHKGTPNTQTTPTLQPSCHTALATGSAVLCRHCAQENGRCLLSSTCLSWDHDRELLWKMSPPERKGTKVMVPRVRELGDALSHSETQMAHLHDDAAEEKVPLPSEQRLMLEQETWEGPVWNKGCSCGPQAFRSLEAHSSWRLAQNIACPCPFLCCSLIPSQLGPVLHPRFLDVSPFCPALLSPILILNLGPVPVWVSSILSLSLLPAFVLDLLLGPWIQGRSQCDLEETQSIHSYCSRGVTIHMLITDKHVHLLLSERTAHKSCVSQASLCVNYLG